MDMRTFYESIDGLDYYDQIKYDTNPHESLEKILAKYPAQEIWRLFVKTDAYPKKLNLKTRHSIEVLWGPEPPQDILDRMEKDNSQIISDAKKAYEKKYNMGDEGYIAGMFSGFKSMVEGLDKDILAPDLEKIHWACTRDIQFTGLKDENRYSKWNDTRVSINHKNSSFLGIYELLDQMKEDSDFAFVKKSRLNEDGTFKALSEDTLINITTLNVNHLEMFITWSYLDLSGKIKPNPDSEFACFRTGAPFKIETLLERAQARLALKILDLDDGYALISQDYIKHYNSNDGIVSKKIDFLKAREKIEKQTNEIIAKYRKQIKDSKNDVDLILDAIVDCVHQLQLKRPFYAGNNRTLMIYLNGLLLQNGLPMVIMKNMELFMAYGKSEMKQALIDGMKNFLKVYQNHPESLANKNKTESLFADLDVNQQQKYADMVQGLLDTVTTTARPAANTMVAETTAPQQMLEPETDIKKQFIQCLEKEIGSGKFFSESNDLMTYAIKLLKDDTCDLDMPSIITALTHTMYHFENSHLGYGGKFGDLFAKESKNPTVIIFEKFIPQTKTLMQESLMGKCIKLDGQLKKEEEKRKQLNSAFFRRVNNSLMMFPVNQKKPPAIKDPYVNEANLDIESVLKSSFAKRR